MDLHESSPAASDRRQAPRTKLVEIAYIGMGPENGGLVLDVSDGGLSFHSVAPVQRSEKIQFLLSLRGHSRIEGMGEVVWTNEMKTICGLKFITLSSDAREHINTWTTQKTLPQPPERRGVAAGKPSFAQGEIAGTPGGSAASAAVPVFAIRPAYDSPLTTPESRAQSVWREPLFLWPLFAILGAAIGFSAYRYGVQVGKAEGSAAVQNASVPAPPETAPPASPSPLAASEEVRPAPVEPPAASASTGPMPKGAFVNASKTEDSPSRTTQVLPANEKAPAAPADRAEEQAQAGLSELAAAETYLAAPSGSRDTAKAARLLWAAVGNGNSTAEVLLADLYVRGDGVTKNCEQGRILLVAAIKSGNIEAQEKLKDLMLNGCKD